MLPKEGDPSSEKAPFEEISTAGELDLETADLETLRKSFLEEKEKAEKYLASGREQWRITLISRGVRSRNERNWLNSPMEG